MAGRRGLVVPQNTFLDNIIKKTSGTHEHFLLASAQIVDSPIVYCSDGFIKMTGYKKNQVVKKKANCSFMYGSLTTKDAVRLLRSSIQEKQDSQIEILFYKRDATPFWVLLNIGLIYDELNEGVLFLLTFQDITEFKEPINPSYRKHRWSEFNRVLHTKPMPDNPISKAKEEKNRLYINQLMEDNVRILPEYKQEIPDTPRYVILHCSTPKIIWDWFILIFILYTATSVPFIVCFDFDSLPMSIADTVVDFMFLIDIVFNFHTSYVGDDGAIVFDVKQIRRTYFRSWFFVDLVTSLPYGLLGILIGGGVGQGITNMIGFLKAVRLLRLNRVVRALDQYLEYGFITLILWMLFFCLCAHWMACIFFAIADHYDNFADIGWVRAMSDQTMQPLVIVNGTLVEKPTLASLYMSSLYFSLTSLTSIGFGNIAPNTTAEKIFSCVTMIFGGLCYAVIFGQVTAIVQQAQKKSESYHQTLDNMRSFCKLYRVPKEISTRIIDYYMYTWVLNRGVDTNQVLLNCPKDLQSDICIHLNRKIIDSTPAFGELSNAVLRAVARNFAIHRVAPGERVVHEGESLDTLFFIGSGSFEVTQKGKVVGLLGEADVFGDDVCRFNDVGRSVADVFALTYADVHAIGRDELMNALAFYPEYGIQFAKVFRLSFCLRDEITMRKLSSHPRTKSTFLAKGMEGRRYTMVEEMQQHVYDTDSNSGDLGTPNSQNMTDTDPPSKPFNKPTKTRHVYANGMEGIPENDELDPSGDDEDFRRWSDYQNSTSASEGLLNEITGMKSDVRREIEVMGGKMNQLEQNISTILSLLQERGFKSPEASNSTLVLQPTKTPEAARSRAASILSRVKSEMPEDPLPDWVEMENFGMTGNAKVDETVKSEDDVGKEEENEEQEEEPKRIGGKLTKKRKLEAKRKKKKAVKAARKVDSDEEKETNEPEISVTLPEAQQPGDWLEYVADVEMNEVLSQADQPEFQEDESRSHSISDPGPTDNQPGDDEQARYEDTKGVLSQADQPEFQEDEAQQKPDDELLKPAGDDDPGMLSSSSQPNEDGKKKRKKKKGKKSKRKKEAEGDGTTPSESPGPSGDAASHVAITIPDEHDSVSYPGPADTQPEDDEQPERRQSPRSNSPVSDGHRSSSGASTKDRQDNSPERNATPEEDNSSTSRVPSPEPDRRSPAPGEAAPGTPFRKNSDVSLDIVDFNADDYSHLNNKAPQFVD